MQPSSKVTARWEGDVLVVCVPLRLGAGLNGREHWRARSTRVKRERAVTDAVLRSRDVARERLAGCVALPGPVRIVRVSPGNGMDDDNVAGACKAVRDAIAKWAGVDDGDPRWDWRYGQRRGEWSVEIRFGAGA